MSDIFQETSAASKETCRTCANRERHECGAKIIQYCNAIKSNRTHNGLKKIKVTDPACDLFKNELIAAMEKAVKERWDRFDRIFQKATGKPFAEADNDLYNYEKSVVDEAQRIARYIIGKGGSWKKWWKKFCGKDNDSYSFVQNLQKDGYKDWWDGHSGNSGSAAVFFARCLFERPDLFQYLHGALSPLVGDKGYHDDRSDLPKHD